MPKHDPQDADLLYQSFMMDGMSSKEATRNVEAMTGVRPSGAKNEATAAVSPESIESALASTDRSWINNEVRKAAGGDLRDNSVVSDALDFADRGLLTVSEVQKQMTQKWADPEEYTKWTYKAKKRLANMTEQLVGGAAVTFDNIQQAWWSLQTQEGLTEEEKNRTLVPITKARLSAAWARLRPADPFDPKYEEKPTSPEAEATLESMDDTWALGQLSQSGGMTADEAYAKANGDEWIDKEPRYWERLMNRTDKITSEQMLEKALGGPEELDKFLSNHQVLGPALAGSALFLNDVLNDPTILVPTVGFDKAVQAGIVKIPGVAPALSKVAKGPVGRVARTNVLGKRAPTADLLNTSKQLTAMRNGVMKQLETKKGDANLMRELVQIDNRLAENELALHARNGNVPTLTEPKNPVRKEADSVYIGGMGIEAARRKALALEHASYEEVESALKYTGYRNTKDFEKAIGRANEAIRTGKHTDADLEVLNKFERLPDNVKKHLDTRGFSRERIFRKTALNKPALELKGFTEEDALRVQRQQAGLGADDAQYASDGIYRVAQGAKAEDIYTPAFDVPDFSNLGHGDYAKFSDDLAVEVLEDGRKIITQDGQRVFSDVDQMKMFFPGRLGGMVPGSWHYNTGKMLRRFEATQAKGVDLLRLGRQPGSSLPEPVYNVYRASQGNYLSHTVAEEDWFAHILRGKKWAKTNRDGRLVATPEGKQNIDNVFGMLDATDDIDRIAKMGKASADEMEIYLQLRKYFDQMADRLKIPRGKRIGEYVPHIMPMKDIAAGARIPEFLGLPPSAWVEFGHLNPRLGAQGYERDLLGALQIYSRGANRKIFMEPAFEKLLGIADAYRQAGTTRSWAKSQMPGEMFDVVEHSTGTIPGYIDDLIREAKGMPGPLDQKLTKLLHGVGEQDFHSLPKHTQSALTVTSLYYSSLLAGNPSFFAQNLLTAMANVGAVHGPLSLLRGFGKLLAPGSEGKAWRVMSAKSGVLGNARRHMEEFSNLTGFSKYVDKVSKFAGKWGAIEASENLNRGFAWSAAMSDMINRSGHTVDELREMGMLQAMNADAVRAAEFTQHVYAKLGRSPHMAQTLGKGFTQLSTQFLSFPFKQGEFLLAGAKEDPSSLFRFIAMSGWMTRVASMAGVDASGALGLGTADPIGEGRPFTSPASDALIDLALYMNATNQNDVAAQERAWEALRQDGKAIIPLGNQITKTGRNAYRLTSGLVTGKGGQMIRGMEGSDVLPTVLSLKNINDAFEARRHGQMIETAKYKMWASQKALDDIMKLHFDGKTPEAVEKLKEFYAEHGKMIADEAGKTWVENRLVSRRFRDLRQYMNSLTPEQLQTMYKQFSGATDEAIPPGGIKELRE